MNMETRMPASASAATMGFRRLCWPMQSMPPSVVRSSRFSGTMQAAWGLCLQRDGQHLVGGGHFQIERNVQLARQARDIVVADMAAVFAQMGGDAVGAGRLRQHARRAPDRDCRRRARCARWRRDRC